MQVKVTHHAVQRFQLRVAWLDDNQAAAFLRKAWSYCSEANEDTMSEFKFLPRDGATARVGSYRDRQFLMVARNNAIMTVLKRADRQ